MKIKYSYKNKSNVFQARESISNSTLLTNHNGSFYLNPLNKCFSKFQGVFATKKFELFKFIDSIELNNEVSEISLDENTVKYKGSFTENYFMPKHLDTLLLETKCSRSKKLILNLDMRKLYDNNEWDRDYTIEIKNHIIFISCRGQYLAIKSNCNFTQVDEWIKKDYLLEQERNSQPSSWYVYKALEFNLKNNSRFFFSFGFDRQGVLDNLIHFEHNFEDMIEQDREHIQKIATKTDTRITVSQFFLTKSIHDFLLVDKMFAGFVAGYPWFNQIWSRDQGIALSSLAKFNEEELLKYIIIELLDVRDDGRVPNIYPDSGNSSADGVYWLYKRLSELIDSKRHALTHEEKSLFVKLLEKSIQNLRIAYESDDHLIKNYSDETWMDTNQREGHCIEIQCMQLFLYKFAYTLTNYSKYKDLESQMKESVKSNFFKGNNLFDKKEDSTIRPNIFIAYYFYPELLTKLQWKKVFDKSINALWCDWGGLSTIDKSSEKYHDSYSGENNASYHNGDSWYFINNLAAFCMHDLDKVHYAQKIEKIKIASLQDMLESGIFGFCSEISDAKEQSSKASLAQLWSSTTLLDLLMK